MCLDWIRLARDVDWWMALVNTVMNLPVPWLAKRLLASQEGLYSMELLKDGRSVKMTTHAIWDTNKETIWTSLNPWTTAILYFKLFNLHLSR
jgi:hypothetical protein